MGLSGEGERDCWTLLTGYVCVQMKTTTECDYLSGEGPEGMGALRHLALYKSHDVARGRAVYALRLPVENKCGPLHTQDSHYM
jgi:hypothetical protein